MFKFFINRITSGHLSKKNLKGSQTKKKRKNYLIALDALKIKL